MYIRYHMLFYMIPKAVFRMREWRKENEFSTLCH